MQQRKKSFKNKHVLTYAFRICNVETLQFFFVEYLFWTSKMWWENKITCKVKSLEHFWVCWHMVERHTTHKHTPLWCCTLWFNTFHYRIYFLNEKLIRRQNRGIHMLQTRFIDYSHNLCCLLRCRHFHQIPNIFSRNSKFNLYKHPIFLHISHQMINKNRLKIRKKKWCNMPFRAQCA